MLAKVTEQLQLRFYCYHYIFTLWYGSYKSKILSALLLPLCLLAMRLEGKTGFCLAVSMQVYDSSLNVTLALYKDKL